VEWCEVMMFQVSIDDVQNQTSRESDQFLSFSLPKREPQIQPYI
jgi:hypothetical protein